MISIDTLKPSEEKQRFGDELAHRGLVLVTSSDSEETLCCSVGASPTYRVTVNARREMRCTCGAKEEPCEHMAAAARVLLNGRRLEKYIYAREQSLGEQMLTALSRAIPGTETVRLLPEICVYDNDTLGLGLTCGQNSMCVVQNIDELLTCYTVGAEMEFTKKFTYQPNEMRFSREDERFLSLLSDYIPLRAKTLDEWLAVKQIDRRAYENKSELKYDKRFLIMEGPLRHSVLRYLENRPFSLIVDNKRQLQNRISTMDLPLCFNLSLSGGELKIQTFGMEGLRMVSPNARYVLWEGNIVHLHSAQARVCRLLCLQGMSFRYSAEHSEEMLSSLMPALGTVGKVVPSAELSSRILKEPLRSVVYLDAVDGFVETRVEYHYGDTVFHPFSSVPSVLGESVPANAMILRDGLAESKLMDFFANAGFTVRNGRILLRRTNDILRFCTQGISHLEELADVYASTAFNRVKPRRLHAKASFRSSGGRLIFELLEESGNALEVYPVLKALEQKQQYVRLKSGEFLDLRDMGGMADVMGEMLATAKLDDPEADDEAKEIRFSEYRAVYMDEMLRLAGARTEIDPQVEKMEKALTQSAELSSVSMSKRLYQKLSGYQRRGAGWLLSLHESHMGGILADEMGLGKTVQVIALLSAVKHLHGTQKSLIITPTSLTYHWQAEIRRFDDSLTVCLLNGMREERQRTIRELYTDNSVDVVITSYPLLRQDIDLLKELPLRMTVLDEAQSVKNAQSLAAAAVKELNAQARFALTGTPIENSTGELWSIFDYILPGYLGTQTQFMRRYGGGENLEELRGRIRPFLMRRLKNEVMAELPQKNEQCLYASMPLEQKRVYDEMLLRFRDYVGDAANEKTMKNRVQVLDMLTKLREVCCHPRLFYPDYEGQSGKLELMTQLVHSAIENGHRMLIFSQFVKMLKIIQNRLNCEGVQTLYLDGETNPKDRLALCDRFNGGESNVFLISLKAGGTGLNLTGADLVIHYDPWWNPATEDQATDRAHRIGQTREVDVVRLITQGSIEEKVSDLSKKKRALFEKVIEAGETDLTKLTDKLIHELFFN